MNNQQAFTSIEISILAEGAHTVGEVDEQTSTSQTTTVPIVRMENGIKGPMAETGMVSPVGVELEGKDDGDSQDASLTTDETKPTAAPQSAPQRAAGIQPSVLIIEDTTELAEVIQATLERMDILTAHETHGARALAKFDEMQPDAILLDISLPDMTGWKILDAIKEKHDQGEIAMPAIIVITAYGDPANRLVGKLQGVFSYLVKPFTANEVEEVVAQALGPASS
jgi:CheY-like chemotaxis protein